MGTPLTVATGFSAGVLVSVRGSSLGAASEREDANQRQFP